MNKDINLLETRQSRELFERLLLISYQVSSPVLPLNRIMHWQAVRSGLDVGTPILDSGRTFVFGGYFYNFSTPTIGLSEIETALERGRELHATQYLVPTVRDDVNSTALAKYGFVKIPWFVESIFDIETTVDKDLRQRIGSERIRSLRRLTERANEKYHWEWYSGERLEENQHLIEVVADLHLQNAKKYGHTVNLYPLEVIKALLRSTLKENFLVGIRREKYTEKPVQIVICMQEEERSQLFILVHGKDYSHEAPGQNFYNTLFYELYKYAENRGLRTIFLGRGNHELKMRLGANRSRILSNWLRVEASEAKSELDSLYKIAERTLRLNQAGDKENKNLIRELARNEIKQVRWPFALNDRQRLEYCGYIDLASSVGIRQSTYVQYPDLEQLTLKDAYVQFLREEHERKTTGSFSLSSEKQILLTRGITEAIDLLIRTFCEPGVDRVLTPKPTFPMYKYWSTLAGTKTIEVDLEGQNFDRLPFENISRDDAKITFLCTPNNPLGYSLDLAQISQAAACSSGLVVVDEAYIEFSEMPSAIELISKYPNVVVLRTFSKAWGLAGLRCGIVIADSSVISALQLVQGPFAIPTCVQDEIRSRLSNSRTLFTDVAEICSERDRIAQQLADNLGVTYVFPSDANFLCVRFSNVNAVFEGLCKSHIIVEHAGIDLPDCLRISVGGRIENDKLLFAIQNMCR